MIYLATPYSDPDPAIREQRFQRVNKVAARLMKAGWHVFSPISHTHPIALAGDLPEGWDYWESYDRMMLAMCARLCVLNADGWQTSVGVQAEIKLAQELGLPVEHLKGNYWIN